MGLQDLKTDRSEQLFLRMAQVMPAGSTRSTTFYEPYPVALARGSGYLVVDLDGNEYIDLLGNYTALIHGQAHPAILNAINQAAASGYVNPAPNVLQAELAERLCDRVPSVTKVRFTNSGTEAVMMAVRVARAITGRDRLIKVIGGFHGSWEQVAVGSSEDQDFTAASATADPGVPAAIAAMLTSLTYNDVDQLDKAVERYKDELAAIIVEPVLGHVVEPATRDYLQRARQLADSSGALLIFDEVITLRLHRGGLQELFDVSPDLTTMGKIIGGGLPIGAIGGGDETMAIFDPRSDYWIEHHGTTNGNGLSMAAGVATLDLLPQDEIDRINALGDSLSSRLAAVLEESDLELRLTSYGSIMNMRGSSADLTRLHRAALDVGLYFAPRGMLCISTPMDEDVIEVVSARFEQAVIDATRPALL